MLTFDLKTLIFVFLLLLLTTAAGGYWFMRRRHRSSVMLGDGVPLLTILDDAPFGVAALDATLAWPDNVWMGVTVENYDYISRIDALRQSHAAVKFLSLEPLLGPLPALDLRAIDWVIVGGESGPGARPLASAWVMDLRDQCLAANIPFFFKQWGGARKKQAGRLLEGRQWNQMPAMAEI